jgi:small subunit ribosomal protein S6
MREYETTFIVQPEISDEGTLEILTRLDGMLEKSGAIRLLHDDQGKRRLAYDIRKFQKGRYITSYYLSEGDAVAPIERTLRLEESVLRFLTVMADPDVTDIEARKAKAVEDERAHAERAAERALREAEEERAREAEMRAGEREDREREERDRERDERDREDRDRETERADEPREEGE